MIQYFSTILRPVLVGGTVDSQPVFHHKVNYFAYLVSQLKYALYIIHVSYTERSKQTHNKSFENVSNLKHFGMTPTIQNCMHEEIKDTLNSENACYQLIQCGLHIFYQILLVLLHGCETWSLNIMARMQVKLKYV